MERERPRPRSPLGIIAATVALLTACLAFFPMSATAAEPGLELLQVGWDGVVMPGSWSPVKLRVTGGSADAAVRVEVVLQNRYQPGPQATPMDFPVGAYGQEVALPAGVAKEITLWVPDPGSGGTSGLLGLARLTAGDQLLAEQKLSSSRVTRTPSWPLVGVLADSPALARSLSQVEMAVQGLPAPLSTAKLSATDLPTAAEWMDGLGALVVQGNAAATLTGEQKRAVRGWVNSGGHLLLAGGPEAARAMAILPPDTLSATIDGTDSAADLSGLATWSGAPTPISGPGPLARLRASGGSLLAGTSALPLAWRWGSGQGSVTWLAVDPALEPLASWPGTPLLLKRALEPALPPPDENEKMRYIRMQGQNLPQQLQGAVESLPPEAFPDWRTIALILGGFALVAGPLLHLLLWRTGRRGWIWLAVPAAALLLSASLYYLGVGRAGRDVLINTVAYLRLDPEGGQSQQTMLAGFFAPTYSRLSVEVAGQSPVRVVSQNSGPFGLPGALTLAVEPPFHVIGGRDTRVEFGSGQYGMRSVALTQSLGPETGRITPRLGLEGGLIKGSLRNDTPYLLEDAAVVIGQNVVKLGSLAPGQTTPVVLDSASPANPFQGDFPLSWRILGQPRGGPSVAGPAGISVRAVPPPYPGSYAVTSAMSIPEQWELPPDPEVQRRARLLEPLLNVPSGPGGPRLPLIFLAFTRSAVGRVPSTAGEHPHYQLTLLQQPLRLELPPGPFALPPGLSLPEQEAQMGGYGGGSNGTISWIQLMGGSVTFAYHPPLPFGATVEALEITTQQMGQTAPWGPGKPPPPPPVGGPNPSPGPAEAGHFSIYNHQSAGWDPLPGGQDRARLESPAAYLGSDGTVRVQVSVESDRMLQFLIPELTVEGRVPE